MKKVVWLLGYLFLLLQQASGQELFPLNEPASSIPKGVLGIRAQGELYHELETYRNLLMIKAQYGLTSRLSVMASASVSNHHGKYLPADLVNHTHSGNQTFYYTQNTQKGIHYPYRFNGFYLYAKYRFLSLDGPNRHFRMAGYGEWSNVNQAHDEAEPNLMDDTRGFGGGLITTYLQDHFAASLTAGMMIPGIYKETLEGTGGDPDVYTEFTYGNAFQCNLSLGYLVYPRAYADYSQSNWNVYLELMGKVYDGASVVQNGVAVETQSFALEPGYYIEVYPGIQHIVNSNLRIDLSIGFNAVKKSYVHFYPVYSIGVQRYFFFKKPVKPAGSGKS